MDKISIVTVVFNRKEEFEETIENILSQTYDNLEIIIIDGGSTDGTVDIIKKYDHKIAYWVSESDKNIYHAMNKGVIKATGKWINFMNAGDLYYDKNVIKNVFANSDYKGVDLLIGNSIIEYDEFSRRYQNGNLSEIWKGARFIHQSCFIKTEFQRLNLYNENNEISADFEFFFNSIEISKIKTYNLNNFVSIFRAGGLSDKRRIEALVANFKLVQNTFRFSPKVFSFYILIILKETFKFVVKNILPENVVKVIQKYIYGNK
tara:strand:- start:2057 stop:2842 length:786 start_codon:yes stop_codon:yes gene_type:complete